MKKSIIIGLMAAFVFSTAFGTAALARNSATSTEGDFATSTPRKVKPAFDSACIIPAVEKRENAVIAAHDVFSGAMKTSLTKRKTALLAAWAKTDNKERRKARNEAWSAFRKESREARKTYLAAVKAAWKTFKTEGKACRMDVSGAEPEGLDISVAAAASNSANQQ